MKYLKTFEEISPEYIQGKINAHKASSASDTKGGQVKRLQTAVDDKLTDRANNTPEAVAAREAAEKREAEIAQKQEKIRNNPYVKRLEEKGIEILRTQEPDGDIGKVVSTRVNAILGYDREGNPGGIFLEHPITLNKTELYVNKEGISCDPEELRDVCCPSDEGWGNYQEAKQIAILGFTKATLVNLKFILKDVFGVGNGQSVIMNSKKVLDEDTFEYNSEMRTYKGDGDKIMKLGFPCEDFVNYLDDLKR